MMGQIIAAVFVVLVALIVLGIRAAKRANARRTERIREWSFRSGYNFTPGPMPAQQLAPISQFALAGETVEANARNVASGSRIMLFDFDHATRHQYGAHNNRTEYRRRTSSCALFQLDEPLPRFSFSAMSTADPSSLAGRMMSAAIHMAEGRGGVIAIDDRPGFLLHTDDDADRVKSLFREPHFFDDKCGWDVQSLGTWMLISSRNSVEPEKYDEFANVTRTIYDHFRHSSS